MQAFWSGTSQLRTTLAQGLSHRQGLQLYHHSQLTTLCSALDVNQENH